MVSAEQDLPQVKLIPQKRKLSTGGSSPAWKWLAGDLNQISKIPLQCSCWTKPCCGV